VISVVGNTANTTVTIDCLYEVIYDVSIANLWRKTNNCLHTLYRSKFTAAELYRAVSVLQHGFLVKT